MTTKSLFPEPLRQSDKHTAQDGTTDLQHHALPTNTDQHLSFNEQLCCSTLLCVGSTGHTEGQRGVAAAVRLTQAPERSGPVSEQWKTFNENVGIKFKLFLCQVNLNTFNCKSTSALDKHCS